MGEVSGKSEDLQRKVLNTMKQIFQTAQQNNLVGSNRPKGLKIPLTQPMIALKF